MQKRILKAGTVATLVLSAILLAGDDGRARQDESVVSLTDVKCCYHGGPGSEECCQRLRKGDDGYTGGRGSGWLDRCLRYRY